MKRLGLFFILILLITLVTGITSQEVYSRSTGKIWSSPNLGISTTVSGTGFVGHITVYWDDTVIPTVPYDVLPDPASGYFSVTPIAYTACPTLKIVGGGIRYSHSLDTTYSSWLSSLP